MFVCKYCKKEFTVNYRIGKKIINFCNKSCKTKFQRQGFYSKNQLEDAIILLIKKQNKYLTTGEIISLLNISSKTLTKYNISIISVNKNAGFSKPRYIFETICKKYISNMIKDIEFEKSFVSLKSPKNYPLRFDAYSKKYNLLIEFDGDHHTNKKHSWYSEYSNSLDLLKNEWAEKNNISLVRIPYSRKVDSAYLQNILYLKIN